MATGDKFNAIYIGNSADREAPAGTRGTYSDIDNTSYATDEANWAVVIGKYNKDQMQIVQLTSYHSVVQNDIIGLDNYGGNHLGIHADGREGVEYSIVGGNIIGDGHATGLVSGTGYPTGTRNVDWTAIDNDGWYNAKITYRLANGTLATKDLIVNVFQTDVGDVFIHPNTLANVAQMSNLNIVQIELVSLAHPNVLAVVNDSWNFTGTTIFCFAAGTGIETRDGVRPVEEISEGCEVLTRDHGVKPVRWIGCRHLNVFDLALNPNLRPIRIRAGALGDNSPLQDLILSPQHRVLVRSKIAENMFGRREVLVAAKHLLSIDGIEVAEDMTSITYWHFMFDAHEIVMSNGAETESLYTGVEALKSVGAEARAEIFALFPDLERGGQQSKARPFLTGQQGRKLAQRHSQKQRILVS